MNYKNDSQKHFLPSDVHIVCKVKYMVVWVLLHEYIVIIMEQVCGYWFNK